MNTTVQEPTTIEQAYTLRDHAKKLYLEHAYYEATDELGNALSAAIKLLPENSHEIGDFYFEYAQSYLCQQQLEQLTSPDANAKEEHEKKEQVPLEKEAATQAEESDISSEEEVMNSLDAAQDLYSTFAKQLTDPKEQQKAFSKLGDIHSKKAEAFCFYEDYKSALEECGLAEEIQNRQGKSRSLANVYYLKGLALSSMKKGSQDSLKCFAECNRILTELKANSGTDPNEAKEIEDVLRDLAKKMEDVEKEAKEIPLQNMQVKEEAKQEVKEEKNLTTVMEPEKVEAKLPENEPKIAQGIELKENVLPISQPQEIPMCIPKPINDIEAAQAKEEAKIILSIQKEEIKMEPATQPPSNPISVLAPSENSSNSVQQTIQKSEEVKCEMEKKDNEMQPVKPTIITEQSSEKIGDESLLKKRAFNDVTEEGPQKKVVKTEE